MWKWECLALHIQLEAAGLRQAHWQEEQYFVSAKEPTLFALCGERAGSAEQTNIRRVRSMTSKLDNFLSHQMCWTTGYWH